MGERLLPIHSSLSSFAENVRQLPVNTTFRANIKGVTVSADPTTPLSFMYRYTDNNGTQFSYSCPVSPYASKEGLVERSEQIFELASSGEFPPHVSELLLEHALLITEAATKAHPLRRNPYE